VHGGGAKGRSYRGNDPDIGGPDALATIGSGVRRAPVAHAVATVAGPCEPFAGAPEAPQETQAKKNPHRCR
jgi:hypothetical protein